MKTYLFEAEPWECRVFEDLRGEHDIRCVDGPLGDENAEEFSDAEAVSVFIYSILKESTLKKLKKLRLIATRSTGYDHIDLEYCGKHGITVCNVPAYGDNTVAEHVFALLLTISHKMYQAVDRTRRGDFTLGGLQGFDLRGKTLGVIGTGSIGLCVIEIARGFKMNVLAFDVHPNHEAAKRLEFEYVEMDNLLARSDIVTLHVPGNRKTHHLISHEQIDKMKRGVVLINTARGQIVDMQALVRALAEGKISAAGLDVLPEEPTIREEAELLRSVYERKHNLEDLLANHVILQLRNVVVTPHSAFNTREAVGRINETTAENLRAFARGNPIHVVTGE